MLTKYCLDKKKKWRVWWGMEPGPFVQRADGITTAPWVLMALMKGSLV